MGKNMKYDMEAGIILYGCSWKPYLLESSGFRCLRLASLCAVSRVRARNHLDCTCSRHSMGMQSGIHKFIASQRTDQTDSMEAISPPKKKLKSVHVP